MTSRRRRPTLCPSCVGPVRRLAALGGTFAAAVLLLTAQPARADEKAEAQKRFRSGEVAFKAGDYVVAAEAFEEAYALLPLPAIAFSTAQSYRLQYFIDKQPARLRRAVELYRVYVDQTPKGGRREDAVANLAEVEPLLGRLDGTATVTFTVAAEPPSTDQAPLLSLEARVGYGATLGGGAGASALGLSPVTFAALAELAIAEAPRTGLYGGVIAEGGDRGAVGGMVGLRLHPDGTRLRASGAGVSLLVPYRLFGVSAGLGRCFGFARSVALCGDVEGTLYFAGNDLPDGRMAAQVQLLLGVAVDVL